MKSLFLLGAACICFAACSSNTNEDATTTTAPAVTTAPATAFRDTPAPAPAPIPDTTGPLNRRSGASRGTRADAVPDSRTNSASRTTTVKTRTTTTTTSYGSPKLDSNEALVKKGREEEFMRTKIHENNSIDGGGQ